MDDPTLHIIIVNWNVRDLLANCLDSIVSQGTLQDDGFVTLDDGSSVKVTVVDNHSSDDSVALLERNYGWVDLVKSNTNLGFTRGNNLALEQSRGEYIMLLNPDTRLEAGALRIMLDYARAHSDVAVIGPKLLYGDGSPQSSRRRFPTLTTALFESTLLESWFPNNRWARAYRLADTDDDATQDVDWVNGACMLAKKAAVKPLGWLDPSYFMYSEELDWCKRIRDAGWRVVYLPQAAVIHYEGQSSGQIVAQRDIYFHSSKVYYFDKYHGRWAAEFLRCFLLASLRQSWLIEALKWLLGHKRPLRQARMTAYKEVIHSGLRAAGNGLEVPRA